YGRDTQRVEVRNLLDHTRERSRVPNAGTGRTGEAADVHFVDDRLVNWTPERLVALPVVGRRVHDRAAHRRRDVVVGSNGLRALPKMLSNPARLRTDEHFVGIEAMTRCDIRWPIHAECVKGSWSAASNKHVPGM